MTATPQGHRRALERETKSCVARTRSEAIAEQSFAESPQEAGREAHNRPNVRMFQRVPDCTQLEIGKERELGGGVSVKPLLDRDSCEVASRTSSVLSIDCVSIFGNRDFENWRRRRVAHRATLVPKTIAG